MKRKKIDVNFKYCGKTRIERFWEKVHKTDKCWEWTAQIGAGGYGRFGQMYAHRVSWIIKNGPIPGKLNVLHKCDNVTCVNPDHLFLGTQGDNMRDCLNKGRYAIRAGEENSFSKLTNKEVRMIRRLYGKYTSYQLADMFHCTRPNVSSILRYKTWKHI